MSDETPEPARYDGPSGGWGSLRSIARHLVQEMPSPAVLETLARQNKAAGHMCTSCAWGKPRDPHVFEFCENGAKATIWELTGDRCTPEFFRDHTVTELLARADYDLEIEGRLTYPLRYDAASDRYVPCDWREAFLAIGRKLRAMNPRDAVFYTSGRASLETSYLYQLFARAFGHANLPDSSNMCHETTSVGLKKVLGVSVGSCTLDDFESCDAIFHFGQNTGTSSPRFLHPLQRAVKRGCRLVTFNPVREKGLESFLDPQNPVEMLTGADTKLSDMYLQVRPGGDIAAIMGLAKHLLALDDAARAKGGEAVIDHAFLAEHTHGFEAFESAARAASWDEIERTSGLTRADLEAAADIYAGAKRVIGVYGMGLTQHVHGSQSVGMLVNLLLMRGNVGRPGAGVCPVRGHSNVQGQRTVGITEKPELAPLDKLAEMFGIDPPRDKGLGLIGTCDGVREGRVKAFVGLGGNFVRAIPERDAMEAAWRRLELTVHIATKLNRTHLLAGRESYLLPCLARSEEDLQATGPQAVTMEDSFSHIHGSIGRRSPASPHLKSELAIVAGLAKATLDPNPRLRWDDWRGDYGLVRDLIEATYPDKFRDFNGRMFRPGGFYRGNAARERRWKTESGRAEFTCPTTMTALGTGDAPGRFHLVTLRSNDQFNTTIYGFRDRLRGLEGPRDILLISPAEMERHGLRAGQRVTLVGDAGDDVRREVVGLAVTPFDLPDGCVGGYYPEMNALVPLWYHDKASDTPGSKGVPVRIEAGRRP